MRLMNQMTFLAAFLFMAACAYGQDVHYNYDRSANFVAYKPTNGSSCCRIS